MKERNGRSELTFNHLMDLRKTNLTKEQTAGLIDLMLMEEGMTPEQLRRVAGVTREKLKQWRKKGGLKFNLNKAEDILTHNLMMDLNKKTLDPFTRAKRIETYRERLGLSRRELARRLRIPQSTLGDWCRWTKITNDEYIEMKSNGMNDTDIYRELRAATFDKQKLKIDLELERAIKTFKIFTIAPISSHKTLDLISQLQKQLTRLQKKIQEKQAMIEVEVRKQ